MALPVKALPHPLTAGTSEGADLDRDVERLAVLDVACTVNLHAMMPLETPVRSSMQETCALVQTGERAENPSAAPRMLGKLLLSNVLALTMHGSSRRLKPSSR